MPRARAAPRLVGRSCPELERTSLGPQALPQNLRPFRQMRREDQKNRTRIGPHLRQARSAESQVISVAKIGYVRWSEVSDIDDEGITLPMATRVAVPLADVGRQMGASVHDNVPLKPLALTHV